MALHRREYVQGLQRGFAVIKTFSADAPALTIADLASRTGLTRAVARRYLFTLEELGCVARNGATFTLTPRILDLGFTYLSTIEVPKAAQPFMERLTQQLHESCSVSVLDGSDCVYVARVSAKRIMSINLSVGSRLPAHATSMGKVLLAHLDAERLAAYFAASPLAPMTRRTICTEAALRRALDGVRARGYAFADQESEDGVRTVAVPLFDRRHHVAAAMNVSCHASRVSMRELKSRFLPALVDAAREISLALGAHVERLYPPRARLA